MVPFIYLNRPTVARPRIISFFRSLRTSSSSSPTTTTTTTTPIGAIGFCWGGKYAIQLCANLASDRDPSLPSQPLINAAFTAHPSNVLIPDEIAAVELPLSICIGTEDFALKMEGVEKIRGILKEKEKDGEEKKKMRVKSEVVVVEGAKHGFAIRGDKASEDEVRQEEVAFEQAVKWLGSRLGEGWREESEIM